MVIKDSPAFNCSLVENINKETSVNEENKEKHQFCLAQLIIYLLAHKCKQLEPTF